MCVSAWEDVRCMCVSVCVWEGGEEKGRLPGEGT